MPDPAIVITGIGAVTPLGLDWPTTWSALREGRSGIGPLTLVDPSRTTATVAAEVRGFDGEAVAGRREARRMDRASLFAVAAAREAWQASGAQAAPDRGAIVIGSAVGGSRRSRRACARSSSAGRTASRPT